MFITNEIFSSPLAALQADTNVRFWHVAELDRKTPWFLVNLREAESDDRDDAEVFSQVRTLLVDSAADVQALIKANANSHCRFNAVYAVLPERNGDHLGWRIEQLRSLLEAENPLDGRFKVEILETTSGDLVPTHSTTLPVGKLRILSERFRFPVRSADSTPIKRHASRLRAPSSMSGKRSAAR